MSKYLKEKLRDRAGQLIELLDLDAPDTILALQVRLIMDAATADFGEDLYREIGEAAKVNTRQRFALCQTCDSEVSIRLSHPPLCEQCEAKQEAMADEMEKSMQRDDEEEAKMNRLPDIIHRETGDDDEPA